MTPVLVWVRILVRVPLFVFLFFSFFLSFFLFLSLSFLSTLLLFLLYAYPPVSVVLLWICHPFFSAYPPVSVVVSLGLSPLLLFLLYAYPPVSVVWFSESIFRLSPSRLFCVFLYVPRLLFFFLLVARSCPRLNPRLLHKYLLHSTHLHNDGKEGKSRENCKESPAGAADIPRPPVGIEAQKQLSKGDNVEGQCAETVQLFELFVTRRAEHARHSLRRQHGCAHQRLQRHGNRHEETDLSVPRCEVLLVALSL